PPGVVAQAAVGVILVDAIVEGAGRGLVAQLVLGEVGHRPQQVVGDLGVVERAGQARVLGEQGLGVAAAAVAQEQIDRVGGEALVGVLGDHLPQAIPGDRDRGVIGRRRRLGALERELTGAEEAVRRRAGIAAGALGDRGVRGDRVGGAAGV